MLLVCGVSWSFCGLNEGGVPVCAYLLVEVKVFVRYVMSAKVEVGILLKRRVVVVVVVVSG